ncbi:DUF6029 family protein [Ancylomarina sp. DW003]|nr:DUF6029 family protein [Ancylomarina sp. DW003]MDE5422721.1 DUF6029 family protein [Ancylomarina sp. DW003]
MKKIIICFVALAIPFVVLSQETNTQEKTRFKRFLNNLSGSFESNAQWYLDDDKTGDFEEDEHIRANSYLKLDYNFLGNFSIGLQAESYMPEPLLNYDWLYNEKFDLAQYYVNYKTKKLDVTAGYFYEQFGNGLVFRAWEDRALGVNNSIRGGKVRYNPTDFLELTALYGKQRRGLDVSESNVLGINSEFNLRNLLDVDLFDELSLGFSYVNKSEDYGYVNDVVSVPNHVDAYSVRLDLSIKNLYSNIEYVKKSDDLRWKSENKLFDGNALYFNLGYSKKGLGINSTFRRLENMNFYSQREDLNGRINLTNRGTLNYLPALTKQYDYTLANIYLYQAQPGLSVEDYQTVQVKAGEIGYQIDVFYKFKKGSLLGGRYGTKVTANLSYWADLNTKVSDPNGIPYFSSDALTYETDFFKFGEKLFRDFNLEVRKKWSPKLSSIFTYINLYYNADYFKANNKEVDAWIGIAESTYKFGKGKSLRLEAQHLLTDDDSKNWLGGTIEYFHNSNFGIYFNDSYNYEESDVEENSKIHFFNVGGSFTKGATRVALNYGRQRGGLICVGGVCRPVSKNTGITLNLTTSF